jgi:hypothetical protein
MKKLLTVTAVCVAVMLVVLPMTYGQDKAAPPAERTFEGQLTKVDANAKSITVKGAAAEMTFEYTDATPVVGSDGKPQGIAGKTGTPLKVTYRDAEGKHTALKIEILEKR